MSLRAQEVNTSRKEFDKVANKNTTVAEFTKYAKSKEKQYPRIWYAGSPEDYVGDIILQEKPEGSKYKFLVQLPNEFGIKQQLIQIVSEEDFNNPYFKAGFLSIMDIIKTNTIDVYRYFSKQSAHSDYLFVVKQRVHLDSTIPQWVWSNPKKVNNGTENLSSQAG